MAQTLSVLGELPVDVEARSAQAIHRLRIIDVRAGALVAKPTGDHPQPHTTMTLTATSGRRHAGSVECVVRSANGDRVALDVAFVSLSEGRREMPRAAVDELFLLYAEQEIDAVVTDVSAAGMRFVSPLPMDVDVEVRGMLNVGSCVFPVAGLVRHCAKQGDEFAVGVALRFLREEETRLLSRLGEHSGDGRRAGDAVVPASGVSTEDIRERLRRWAA